MKSDRELLELAFKAYGDDSIIKSPFGFDRVIGYSEEMQCDVMVQWNPLTDDGDAMRLAVGLHMQVSITTESCRAETIPVLGVRINDCDEMAATRRAIVCAAAVVGERMP